MPSVPAGRIRVKVIGAQTADPESPRPYTVYRTVVTYEGDCFERLLRYSEFYAFSKRLKLRSNSSPIKTQFPGKTWSRKTLFDDDLIEARQVMLNEYMQEVSTKELTPASETYLMKLLRIGKYEDGSGGRVSEMSSYKASTVKSDRQTMDVLREADEDKDKVVAEDGTTDVALGAAATLTSVSCELPNITSNATTVLADDERSAIGSRPRITSEEEEQLMLAQQHAIAADARASAPPPRPPSSTSTTNGIAHAPPHKSSSIPPSPYSAIVLQKPALKSSQSLPTRRSRHVGFPIENGPASAPVTRTSSSEEDPLANGALSPEEKYRERISNQLSSISRLLSDSDADTELSSSRSNYNSRLALTA